MIAGVPELTVACAKCGAPGKVESGGVAFCQGCGEVLDGRDPGSLGSEPPMGDGDQRLMIRDKTLLTPSTAFEPPDIPPPVESPEGRMTPTA